MKRASYRAAVEWIAQNVDVEWVGADPASALGCMSVEAVLVTDLFGISEEKLRADLKRRCKQIGRL